MGGSSAPKPDKRMGKAAMKSAETGEAMFEWSKNRAKITDKWATRDRSRYIRKFQPLENRMIREAETWDSPGRKAAAADAAAADVRIAAGNAAGTRSRQAMAMGLDPRSGRFRAGEARAGVDSALAEAGARNLARRTVAAEGDAKRSNMMNFGKGFAVNPATSFAMGTGVGQQGFAGAMQGYNQQASILGQEHGQRMDAWSANNSQMTGLGQAAGALAGAFMFSSEEMKEGKRKGRSPLRAVKGMEIEEWSYKGDPAKTRHVGPYAEDFKRETGKGDGRTIPIIDAIGTTMGAVQELARDVDDLKKQGRSPKRRAA